MGNIGDLFDTRLRYVEAGHVLDLISAELLTDLAQQRRMTCFRAEPSGYWVADGNVIWESAVHDAVVVAVKALLGGVLVVAFAVVGSVVCPKWFAGLFSAAPSVALAGLAVTYVTLGPASATSASFGMIFGAVGFVAYAVTQVALTGRCQPLVASMFGGAVWLAVAMGSYQLAVKR